MFLYSRILHADTANVSAASMPRVATVRLSKFITDVASERKGGDHGRILLKLDIEGSELEVMTDLMLSGALRKLDRVLVEWHLDNDGDDDGDRARFMAGAKKAVETAAYVARKLLGDTTEVIQFDDETYFDQQLSLNGCS